MAEPVSLGLAIASALATAGEVGLATTKLIKDASRTSEQMGQVRHEVRLIELALSRLQPMILEDTEEFPLAAELRIRDLGTAVMGTVMTLSEIQRVVKRVGDPDDPSLIERGKWAIKKSSVDTLVQRLQNDKSSLQLMLEILQWYVEPLTSVPANLGCHKHNHAFV